MKKLTITIEVNSDTEAYLVLNKIELKNTISECTYDSKKYTFTDDEKVKDFLKNKDK